MTKLLGGLSAAALMCLGSGTANAVEGGIYGAPLGGTDIRQAYLPPTPGFYGGLALVGVTANHYAGPNDTIANAPAYVTSIIGGAGILYVYPYNPLGFTVGSSFQLNYITQHQTLTPGGVHLHGNSSGFQDSYSDLFYASHYIGLLGATPGSNVKVKYGLTGAFGLAAEIPLGAYDVTHFSNPGKDTFITIPNMALTYNTGPNWSFFDGTEVSVRFFFDTNKRNPQSGYQGGNLIDLDFSATQRWGNWQFGGAGVLAQQITDDHNTLNAVVAPNGDRYSKLDAGPVIAYDSPLLGATVKFKASFPINHENNYPAKSFVLSIARKLF